MSIALKGKVTDLVAKLSAKGEAQAALEGLAEIAKSEGRKAECFLVDALVQILDATNDKDKKVASAAADTARAVVEMASPFAIDLMMPAFLSGLSVKAKPPQKEATLNMIKDFAARNPKATGYALVTLVSPVADLTCDSDGKVDAFIDLHDVRKVLDLHAPDGGPYYLGTFLVGAYQEILGDLHNLFGDTDAVHVHLDDPEGYHPEHVVEGDEVNDVLRYVQYDPRLLDEKVRLTIEEALRRGEISLEESRLLRKRYQQGLQGYTYLTDG